MRGCHPSLISLSYDGEPCCQTSHREAVDDFAQALDGSSVVDLSRRGVAVADRPHHGEDVAASIEKGGHVPASEVVGAHGASDADLVASVPDPLPELVRGHRIFGDHTAFAERWEVNRPGFSGGCDVPPVW